MRDLKRRTFLQAAGVTLSLPALETFAKTGPAGGATNTAAPKRSVFLGNSLGLYQPEFFPKQAGKNYQMTRLLKPLERHREDFTVFSHLDHGVKGGHHATDAFLSGVKLVDAKSMPNGNISVDQRMAETVGTATRFPSLNLSAVKNNGSNGSNVMSWARNSVKVPHIYGPASLFKIMFGMNRSGGGDKETFELHGSILDHVMSDAKRLNRRLSKRDQEKLGEYFNSVRDVERKIQQREKWRNVPYPKPTIKAPDNDSLLEDVSEIYDLIVLALQLDLTRVMVFEVPHNGYRSGDLGVNKDYHFISHHGRVKDNINNLLTLQEHELGEFARFLDKMKETTDLEGKPLLDTTAVMWGSGLGNAASHLNSDLPIMLAGGGYKLGEHRIMPAAASQRVPLCNLYLSMLQRMGVEDEHFGVSSGTFPGLEMA